MAGRYTIVGGLSIGVMGAAAILRVGNAQLFRPYFGAVEPLLVIGAVALAGIVLLPAVHTKGWFAVRTPWRSGALLRVFALTVVLAAITIAVDLAGAFPESINVGFPESLLFYPVMAYVVEILFHVAPLALLLFGLTRLYPRLRIERALLACIPVVALLEPVAQVILMQRAHPYATWVLAFVAAHLFLFNVLQLHTLVRHGFVSMFAVRIVYYGIWHLAWGEIRL